MSITRQIAVFLVLLFGTALSVSVLLVVGGICCAFFGWEGAILGDLILIGIVVASQTQIERATRPTKRFQK